MINLLESMEQFDFPQDKRLYACSIDDIKDQVWTNDITDREVRLMEFNEFNQGSVKSRVRVQSSGVYSSVYVQLCIYNL